MRADSSRQSVAMAASLALHAAVAALMIGRGAVHLTLEPSPLVFTLVEGATRTAGQGEHAPDLREAAPPSPATTAPAPKVMVARPTEPPPAANPRLLVKKAPPEKPTPAPARTPSSSAPASSSAIAAAVAATSVVGEGGRGDAAHATAPAWEATAHARYEQLLFAWMNRHKDYPLLAQRRGIEGRGSLRVRIDRAGRVLEHALVASTGQGVLDEAALDMVRRANPFPAVPEGYAGGSFEFIAPFEYRLR